MSDDVPEIGIEALEEHLRTGRLVVDVREDDEYHSGHVPGAVHIPLAAVPDRIEVLPAEAPMYVVCAVGGRSARAVRFMRAQGLDAANVAGGAKAWIEAGKPVVLGGEPH